MTPLECPHCGVPRPIGSIAFIQTLVAAYYRVPLAEMTSDRRSRCVAHPRQVAMYLAREMTPQSLPAIGRSFGHRDHTTVMWAISAVESRMVGDRNLTADVAALRERLGG